MPIAGPWSGFRRIGHGLSTAGARRQVAQGKANKLAKRLAKGEKRNRKRMATVAAVYTVAPYVRTPEQVVRSLAPWHEPAAPRPLLEHKRVWASLAKAPEAVLEEAFREALRRDPQRQKNWVGLVDGNQTQLELLEKLSRQHQVSSVAGVVGLKHCSAYGASKFAVEGPSLAVAEEVGQFGIKVTLVEPGFFRTDLLDAANVKWPTERIDDYAAAEVSAQEMWLPYAGKQPGDPGKLGEVLVKLAAMQTPPRVFVAGGDAIAVLASAVEARLRAVHALEEPLEID